MRAGDGPGDPRPPAPSSLPRPKPGRPHSSTQGLQAPWAGPVGMNAASTAIVCGYQRRPASSPIRCSGALSFVASRRVASTPSENGCHPPEENRQPRR